MGTRFYGEVKIADLLHNWQEVQQNDVGNIATCKTLKKAGSGHEAKLANAMIAAEHLPGVSRTLRARSFGLPNHVPTALLTSKVPDPHSWTTSKKCCFISSASLVAGF